MAQTEHVPSYKSAYDMCLYFEQVVRNFSRYHKYSLGADLRDGAREALKLVVRANSLRDKAPILLDLREELEELKVLLRLCHDVKAFPNFNSFEHSIRSICMPDPKGSLIHHIYLLKNKYETVRINRTLILRNNLEMHSCLDV